MTRIQMLDAIETACDRYDMCTNNPNGDCPLACGAEHCCVAAPTFYSDKELADCYEKMFGVPPVTDNPVTHPSHYTQGNIECIDAMVSAFGKEAVAHFCICNAFKYTWRSEHKNGMEDIDKALWYLTKYKELKSNE